MLIALISGSTQRAGWVWPRARRSIRPVQNVSSQSSCRHGGDVRGGPTGMRGAVCTSSISYS